MPNGISRRINRSGFTLIELLVVIGIIVILVGILLPVVSTMRKKAQYTDTLAEITRIAAAVNHYYQDYRAYPGPIPESQIYGNNNVTTQTGVLSGTTAVSQITSTENLTLGLLGGIVPPASATTTTFGYNITYVTLGPRSLNYMNPQTPTPYYDATSPELANNGAGTLTSWTTTPGVTGGVTPAGFTIPEIMDHFSNPHPIIYLRAVTGAGGGTIAACDIPRSTSSPGSQYFYMEVNPYWRVYTSVTNLSNAALPTATKFTTVDVSGSMDYPTSVSFFQNPTVADGFTPRSKDSYILISPGYDGVYGTQDDVMYSN